MRILDRQRYWAFSKAYVICFVSFVGLYVVIDAFSNFDEFLNITREPSRLFPILGRFYAIRSTAIYDRLTGVITMMAAVFTVTWMQRDNELIAMLAAGVSTPRVIRPVIVAAVAVNLMAVANQEYLVPRFADDLQRSHGDDGVRSVIMLGSRRDKNDIVIHGAEGVRQARTIVRFAATLPSAQHAHLEATKARFVPPSDDASPLQGGWILRGTKVTPPSATLDPDVFIPIGEEQARAFPPTTPDGAEPAGPAYFFRSNVSFDALTRRRDWYVYASTREVFEAMNDPVNATERREIEIFLHTRLIRPFLAMALLFVTLPFVLGGVGRNMFANLGMSLGTSATFFAGGFLAQYLATHRHITPELAAWAPLIAFGTVGVARWGAIRT